MRAGCFIESVAGEGGLKILFYWLIALDSLLAIAGAAGSLNVKHHEHRHALLCLAEAHSEASSVSRKPHFSEIVQVHRNHQRSGFCFDLGLFRFRVIGNDGIGQSAKRRYRSGYLKRSTCVAELAKPLSLHAFNSTALSKLRYARSQTKGVPV